MKFIFTDGTKVPKGETIVPSTFTVTFEVTVCGMNRISADSIKNVIQQKYKVAQIKELNAICVVKDQICQ